MRRLTRSPGLERPGEIRCSIVSEGLATRSVVGADLQTVNWLEPGWDGGSRQGLGPKVRR